MSVGLACNHQVPIPVRFIFQKLISPKSTTFMIFDVTVIPWDKIAPAKKLWDCNRSEKKQCREIQRKHSKDVTHFIGSWGQFPPVWVKLRQQSICHVPNRSSGLCCTGYTLHTQGRFLPLQLSHLWFIWPEPFSRDWRTQQLLMKRSKIWGWSSSRAVFHAAAMSGWYRLSHIYSCPFQDLLGCIISLNTTYTLA